MEAAGVVPEKFVFPRLFSDCWRSSSGCEPTTAAAASADPVLTALLWESQEAPGRGPDQDQGLR